MTDSLWSLITTPWALRPDTLLGATLLAVAAALLGEVAWRVLRWPRLMGYCAVGTVLSIAGLGVTGDETELRLAVDVALALLLFEAGTRLNLKWLAHNPWLLATSVAEALLTGVAVRRRWRRRSRWCSSASRRRSCSGSWASVARRGR